MILLGKYNETNLIPKPVEDFHNYNSLEYFCESTSLLEINVLLKEINIPILSDNFSLVNNGTVVLYYKRNENQLYYLINSKHLDFLTLYREYNINKILK